jgi:hypothetical protein
MKNHVINRDHIVEAWISEPQKEETMFNIVTGNVQICVQAHGWQVVLILAGQNNYTRINKSSEQECIEFIEGLNFINV